jgi:hypothetical protein
MQTVSMTDKSLADYMTDYCRKIQALDSSIRFAGLADYSGKLQSSFYRPGLVPLMNKGETEQYVLQSVFRARTRGGFKPQLGEQRYAVAVYDNLIRSTVAITNSEAEHHNLYLLVSLDIDSQYPRVLQKIVDHIAKGKAELFQRTRKLSQGYTD